jgi:hypothetical protein
VSQTYEGTGIKDPNDVEPFMLDWAAWLALTGDAIVDCDAEAPGLDIEDCSFTASTTTVKLGGGADDGEYTATMRIYTAAEEVYNRSILILTMNK